MLRALEFYSGLGGARRRGRRQAGGSGGRRTGKRNWDHPPPPPLDPIPGLHYALVAAAPSATVVAALDVNDTANAVYLSNHRLAPTAVNIATLTAARLDRWAADAWLLSPPCQPYTRRGLRRGGADDRAVSFIALLRRLPEMKVCVAGVWWGGEGCLDAGTRLASPPTPLTFTPRAHPQPLTRAAPPLLHPCGKCSGV